MAKTFTAYPVAAAAYLPGDRRASLTHIVTNDITALTPAGVLCRRVRIESMLIDGALAQAPETATCPACAASYKRQTK